MTIYIVDEFEKGIVPIDNTYKLFQHNLIERCLLFFKLFPGKNRSETYNERSIIVWNKSPPPAHVSG
jgi:hypothetical protein